MDPTYPRLFSPLKIGAHTVKNRIASTAHATRFDCGGLLTDDYVDYYAEKAAGGVGLMITFGSASVHPGSTPSYGSVALWDRRNETRLSRMADSAHGHGAVLLSQATHLGRRSTSRRSGHVVSAPSDIPEPVNHDIPHVMSRGDISDVVQSFARAARRLERCGWDGVEITSFGGHLIEQFWSPAVNTRQDGYGGILENRLRFSREVIEAVAGTVSDDFLVFVRMTVDPLTAALGLNSDAMLEIARAIDSLGRVDLLSVSGGTGATPEAQEATVPTDAYPRSTYNALARRIRAAVHVPVLVAGRILEPSEAETALEDGSCDLVAMTRALIADPTLPTKAERGTADQVRPCIALNQECIGRVNLGLAMRCAVNPDVPTRRTAHHRPRTGQHVVVVGGGPAGLEAARVAATHGDKVTMYEKSPHLGGQLRLIEQIGVHPDIGAYRRWLERELKRLEVKVNTGVEATLSDILHENTDCIVLATGAESFVPSQATTISAPHGTDVDLLRGDLPLHPDQTILVYDREGGSRGADVATFAATRSRRVLLAAPTVSVVEDVEPWLRPSTLKRLAALRISTLPDILLCEHGENPLQHAWTGEALPLENIDAVIFVGYRRAHDLLARADELDTKHSVRAIGDCLAPRRLYDAITEGVRAGHEPVN